MIRPQALLVIAISATLAVASCGPTPSGTMGTSVGSTYSSQPTYSLWSQLSTTADTKQIMLIEAELASRGQTSWGDRYIGQKTASTVGRSVYGRTEQRTGDRNCSDFASPTEAQRFFLAAGGPVRDPHGLDRDGDGNACEWGKTLRSSVSDYRKSIAPKRTVSRAASTSSRCYTGPRGGTYTITASGRKNYSGC